MVTSECKGHLEPWCHQCWPVTLPRTGDPFSLIPPYQKAVTSQCLSSHRSYGPPLYFTISWQRLWHPNHTTIYGFWQVPIMGTTSCVSGFNSFGILRDQAKLSSGFYTCSPQLVWLQQSSSNYLEGKSQVNVISVLVQVLLYYLEATALVVEFRKKYIKPLFDLGRSFLRWQAITQAHSSVPSVKLEINIAGVILLSDMYWTGCTFTHFPISIETFLTLLQLVDATILALLHQTHFLSSEMLSVGC